MAKEFRAQLIIDAETFQALTALRKINSSVKKQTKVIQDTNAQWVNFGKQLIGIGSAAVIATRAFSAMKQVLSDSINISRKFAEEMANINVMLDEQTTKLLPGMAKQVKEMSVEYGEGTATLTKGLFDILSASIAADEAINVLETSVRAAKGGVTDAGVAADALTTILNAYGLEAQEAADISDLLFAINKKGKVTFNEIASSIGGVATNAAVTGLSLEEMGAAIATMTRAGVPAAESVTALNAILLTFLKPTEDAIKQAKKFGLELNTSTLSSEGLVGVMDKLKFATKEETAQIFFNRRALKGWNPLVKQSEGFLRDVAFMSDRAGLALEAYEKQTKNAAFTNKQFNQGVNQVKRAIGDELTPGIQSFQKIFVKSVDVIAKAPTIMSNIITPIKGIVSETKNIIGVNDELKRSNNEMASSSIKNNQKIAESTEALKNSNSTDWEEMLNVRKFVHDEFILIRDENEMLDAESQLRMFDFRKSMIENYMTFNQERIQAQLASENVLVESIKGLYKNLGSAMSSSLSTSFKQILDEGKKFGQIMSDLAKSVRDVFIDMLAKMAAEFIAKHIIMAAVAKVTAKQQIAAATAEGSAKAVSAHAGIPFVGVALGIAAAAALVAAINSLAKLQTGVRGFRGGPAMVGEKGAEIVNLPMGSDVFNAGETRNLLARRNSSGGNTIINFNITGNNFNGTDEETADKIFEVFYERRMQLQGNV
jgi:TP901 family phage tail tape measure protein